MNTVLIIVMVILATIGICTVIERLYAFSMKFRDRVKTKRKRIGKIDILWDSVKQMDDQLVDANKKQLKVENKLGDIGKLADNFDRDMNAYHKNINKDIKNSADKLTKRLDLAFRRINSLVENDTPANERITDIERRQKRYDTSLMTHGKMIGDLQKKVK